MNTTTTVFIADSAKFKASGRVGNGIQDDGTAEEEVLEEVDKGKILDLENILLTIGAGALCLVARWLWNLWRISEANGRRAKADQTLRERGMVAFRYQPSFGVEDRELWAALAGFECSGYIVLDKDGGVVGRLMPKVVGSNRIQERGLRLVVDNTK